jgi:uncharacterized protein YkwD
MKPFIALSAAAGMVAAAAALFVLNLSDSNSQAGLVLSYSEGSNTAVNAEPTLTEDNLQVRSAQPRPDPTTASDLDQENEEPAPTEEILATEEPEATETETAATAEATESPTLTPTATEEPTPTAPPATASGNALLDTVNAVRATFGKSALLPDAALMSAAQSYCRTVGEYFDQNGSLNHEIGGSIGSRFKAHGFTGSAWGEALAWTANAASASLFDEVAASWRNSSGHSALLYSPSTGYGGKAYTHAGAASCTSPGGTGIYVLDVGAY